MNRRLYRSISDRRIGGVAAGTAAYFDIDPSISRVLWLLLAIFTGGAFVIVYLVMWAIVPEEPWSPGMAVAGGPPSSAPVAGAVAGSEVTEAGAGEAGEADSGEAAAPLAEGEMPATTVASGPSTWTGPATRTDTGPGGHVVFGAILILIGGWFLAQQFLPWFNFGLLWPIGLVVVGVLILVAALRRGS